jgi:hypothetical protein
MSGRRPFLAWLLGLTAIAATLADPAPARAQDGFRVTFSAAPGAAGKTHVSGHVTNERAEDVFDVHVTAEALDRRGRVVASGITYVEGRVLRGDSRPFVAVVPDVPGAARYRASVSSFRSLGMQAP